MDFIVKIGIDGHQFNVSLPQEERRLQYLQELIQIEAKIEIKNQLLLSKKGIKIEDLASFDIDSQMLQTTQFTDQKATFTIYLFDVSDSGEQIAYPQPKYEPKMELKQLILTEQAKETLVNLNSNILNQEKLFFQHLQNLKNKYIPYQQKIKSLERISQEIENQIQSFEVLLKMISGYYAQTKQKKNDVLKKYKDSIDKNSQTVKKFDESLDILKKIELHVALQTEQQKFLSDIYYKPESMQKWKNSCLNTSQALRSKIDKTSQAVKKLKQKIKNERNENISQCLTSYKANQQQYQQFIQESKSLLQTVVQSTLDEYNTLRQYMINFSQDINDEPAMYYLSQFELSQEQLQQFDDAVLHLGDHLEKTKQVLTQFTSFKQNNISKIQKVFQNMRGFNKEFEMLNDRLKSYDEEVEKMEKDFSYLLNPVHLPQAYSQALIETSRRKEFRDIFDKKLKSMTILLDSEKEKRKKFLQQYGRILPQDFFGQLKNLTPSIQVINAYADAELPNITGMHQDHYKKRNDSETQVESLKQQIDDLNQQCKQTHLYYQDKTTKKQSTYNELLQLTAKTAMKMFIQRSENKPLGQADVNVKENDSKIVSMKNEYSEQLNTQKQELEKLKIKLQRNEADFESKLVEIDSKNNLIQELQQKLEAATSNYTKIKEDLNKFVGKCENLEMNLIQKNTEIQKQQSAQKQINDQYQQQKSQIQELLKKQQQMNLQSDQSKNQINELEISNQTYHQQVQEYYTEIQNLQQEQEKLRQRLKAVEMEKDNKQIELEKYIAQYNELLESFIEKNQQLESISQCQFQYSQKDKQFAEEQRIYQNKIDNLELALQQKNNEIQVLRNQDQLLLLNQQEDLRQIQQQYEDKINSLTQEKLELTIQVQSLSGQIDYLNQKQKPESEIKLKLSDPQFTFDLSGVCVGKQSIFIPAQTGVYVPLILKNIPISNINDDSLSSISLDSQTRKKQLKVQLNSITQTYREFITDTGLLFISEVSNIQETEDSYLVSVKQPNYVIGFEDQDNQIKSFVV